MAMVGPHGAVGEDFSGLVFVGARCPLVQAKGEPRSWYASLYPSDSQ
jgi:hypothetical protein